MLVISPMRSLVKPITDPCSGAVPDDENEEIGMKLAEMVGRLGELVNAYRHYIEDGVVDKGEWQSLNDIAYQFRVTLMTFLNLISRVYCLPE